MRKNTQPKAPFLLAITVLVSIFMIAPMLLSVMAGLVNNYSAGLKSGLTLRWLGEVWENYGGTVGWSLALALACGAILFATSMGAFGTAFTLASKFEVIPITIYNEFTNYANFALAASLSIALGIVTWLVLFVARRFGANPVAR